MTEGMNRRRLIASLGAGAVVLLAGCDAAQRPPLAGEDVAATPGRGAGAPAVHVYRDPECGCCEAWAAIARDAGYAVTVESRTDMPAIKARHGVPDELQSCHTAIVGGYAIEGHVPLASVARLLADRPADIRGIAVPGMPRGSPGMEMPDGSVDPYQVMAFGAAGRIAVFGA